MEKPQAQHAEYSDGTQMSSAPDKTGVGGIVSEVPTESGLRIREDGHVSQWLIPPMSGTAGALKTQVQLTFTRPNQIILVPQPSDDEMDPLNWSWSKKHLILLTVAWSAFCADFTSAAGSAPIILQSIEFHESISTVNETNSMNVLMMALGGLIWVPMTNIIGRAPTLFWTNLLGFLFSIGTAASPNFRTFYAMRALTGFFITSGQTISIAFIRDIFFFHERARKIGLWALLYIASPFWGPMIGNFVVGGTHSWQNVFWVAAGVCALQLVFMIAFLDETWYNRDIPVSQQPLRAKGFASRLSRVIGAWELRHRRAYYQTVWHSFKRYFQTLAKPELFAVWVAYLLYFMWSIGINITTGILFGTPRAAGGYGYSPTSVGYLYFAPVVGVFLGEIFGHYFNDWLARRYVKKHGGVYQPEVRLFMIYIAAVCMAVGLIVLGQALHHGLSPAAVVMGWGLHTFGTMTTSVAVSAYTLDSHPEAPAEVSGWSNFARAIGGFGVGYFQQPWGAKVGFDVSFGTQAAVVGFGTVLVALVHCFGPWLRLKSGPVE